MFSKDVHFGGVCIALHYVCRGTSNARACSKRCVCTNKQRGWRKRPCPEPRKRQEVLQDCIKFLSTALIRSGKYRILKNSNLNLRSISGTLCQTCTRNLRPESQQCLYLLVLLQWGDLFKNKVHISRSRL